MRKTARFAWMLGALTWSTTFAASAQERDAQVLEPGQLRLLASGEATYITGIFGAAGTIPFDGGYSGPLTQATFAPLVPLATGLDAFFSATAESDGGGVVDPAEVFGGELDVEMGWNTRAFPLGLSLGILPRVELGARSTIFRNERYLRRLTLSGGNVGPNPAPATNAAILSSISAEFSGLGESTLLPVEGSPLAMELQHRIDALTGEQLALPQDSLTRDELVALLEESPFDHLLTEWRLGDLDVEGRVAVLQTFTTLQPPAGMPLAYRLTLQGGVRLPTGRRGETNPLLDQGPQVGFRALSAGAAGDLFLGDRFWLSTAASIRSFSPRTARVGIVPPEGPLAPGYEVRSARYERGREIGFTAIPRFRLTTELSVGTAFRWEHWGDGVYRTATESTSVAGGSRQSLGFSVRYSTLDVSREERPVFPLDVVIGYSGALRGSENIPVTRLGYVRMSLFPRLWGRRAAPAPGVEADDLR